jgi:hypothetical protein
MQRYVGEGSASLCSHCRATRRVGVLARCCEWMLACAIGSGVVAGSGRLMCCWMPMGRVREKSGRCATGLQGSLARCWMWDVYAALEEGCDD